MQIRQVQDDDVAAIVRIWNPVIRDTLITFTSTEKTSADVQEILAQKARNGQPFLGAYDGETLLGFATYGPFRTGQGYIRTAEHSIILAPLAQGRGLGRGLLTQLETEARTRDIHSLIAGISGANPAAIAFHKACGYQQVGHLPRVGFKFNRWLDLILMQKHL